MTSKYIVTLNPDVNVANFNDTTEKIKSLNGKIIQKYDIIPSLVVELPDNKVETLKSCSFIEDIELDQRFYTLQRPKKQKDNKK